MYTASISEIPKCFCENYQKQNAVLGNFKLHFVPLSGDFTVGLPGGILGTVILVYINPEVVNAAFQRV